MNLPTQAECSELFIKYNTPKNVIDHSKKVNLVAIFLAKKLAENDVDINIELVDKASLLHDLVRIPEQINDPELKTKHHAYINYEILKNDYPEMAEVIREHRFEAIINPELLDTWEKKIVSYADKRVNNDQIVNVDTRIKKGLERWKLSGQEDNLDEVLKNLKIMEKQIFNKISLNPKDINEI